MAETQPTWENALCYTATDLRVVQNDTVLNEGVARHVAGDLLVTTGGAGLTLSVAQGGAFISADVDDEGLYHVYNDAPETRTTTAAHATLPRIDQVIATVNDSQISGLADDWVLSVLAGTANASAALTPAGIAASATPLPDRAIVLAYVLVPAAFTGPFVNATHILDARTAGRNPMIRVFRNAAANTSVAPADIVFDAGSFNSFGQTSGAAGTRYNTSTGEFTAPAPGLYRVTCALRATTGAANENIGLQVVVNGAVTDVVSGVPSATIAAMTVFISVVVVVTTAGHKIKVQNFSTAARAISTGPTLTYMTIEKVAG